MDGELPLPWSESSTAMEGVPRVWNQQPAALGFYCGRQAIGSVFVTSIQHIHRHLAQETIDSQDRHVCKGLKLLVILFAALLNLYRFFCNRS